MDNKLKEEWLDAIESHILRGFQSTDYGYERIMITRQQVKTISINGRVMQQPGKEIKIKQCIYIVGDGWVANTDESNKVEFTQIRFETYQGDDLTLQYEETFYWDEPDYFIEIFNKAFGG